MGAGERDVLLFTEKEIAADQKIAHGIEEIDKQHRETFDRMEVRATA